MSVIREQNKTKLHNSISELILRMLDSANIEYEDVEPHILRWYGDNSATAADLLNKSSRKISKVSDTYEIAKKVIEEWVGATPDALDTLQELAAAFHNDADIINKLIAQLAQKVDKSEFKRLTLYPNSNFDDAYFDPLMTWNSSTINMFPAGVYSGTCSSDRLVGLKTTYPNIPDMDVVQVSATVTTHQTVSVIVTQGQTDFSIAHDGWYPSKIEVNGTELLNWSADVNTQVDVLTLNLDDGELPDSADVKFIFISGSPIPQSDKTTNVTMTASIGGVEFKRGFTVTNGTVKTDNNLLMNEWTSPSTDNLDTISFLTLTFEEMATRIADGTLENTIPPPQ